MATVVQSLGSFQDGAAEVTFSYNDNNLSLTAVTVRNDGLPFALTVTLSDPADGSAFFTRTRTIGQGTVSQNVTGAGIKVTLSPRGGAVLPFAVQLGGT